jgi:hypothetical protein
MTNRARAALETIVMDLIDRAADHRIPYVNLTQEGWAAGRASLDTP